jgi:hypothetical protein
MSNSHQYRRPDRNGQPDYLYPPYVSSRKRAPTKPTAISPRNLRARQSANASSSPAASSTIQAAPFPALSSNCGKPTPPAAIATRTISTVRRSIQISAAAAAS